VRDILETKTVNRNIKF